MKKVQLLALLSLLFIIISCNDDSFDTAIDIEESTSNIDKKRSCGVHDHMSELMLNSEYKNQYNNRIQAFEKVNLTRQEKAACNNPVVIPVAVHYQGASTSQSACLISLAQNQINILNEDYAGTNSDISKWNNQAASSFPGVSNGEACLRFVLANKNHPSGFGLQNGNPAITINQTNGDQSNQWSGYLNIFVQPNTGLLGYAPFGGTGNGDGVVIDAAAFGSGNGCGNVSPDAPYNLGRTLTHEVGHYFLLDHIWGNGCNQDDDVADTPNQSNDYSGCPNVGASSCGSTDMHMNYMDYTNDACMYMFSAGQALRMENYVSANLSNLTNNASNVIDGQGGGNNGGDDGNDEDDSNDNGNDDSDEDNDNDDTGEEEEEEEPEVCETPGTSTVTIINNSKVKVDWADQPGAIRYRIRYRQVGTRQWTAKNTTPSEKTISSLETDVTYEYQLRTRCSDGWTRFGAKQTFIIDTSGGGNDDNDPDGSYTLKLTLDDYGSETTWYILDEQYNAVFEGGPYRDGKAGQVISVDLPLTSGCYELELQDAYGDGICCDYGDGSAVIENANGQVVAELDGRFGTFDYVAFCIDGNGLRVKDRKRDTKKKSSKKK